MKLHSRAISRRPVPLAYVRLAFVTLLVLMLAWGCAGRDVAVPKGIEQVQHVIVIYMETWSFNGQCGLFPGANGIAHAGDTIRQVRKDGSPYTTLPQPLFNGPPEPRIPSDLPVRPFDLARYLPPDQLTSNPVHLFSQEQYQINGGRMDQVVAWNDAGGDHGGLPMSYYDVTDMPVGRLARQYTLCDHFFHCGWNDAEAGRPDPLFQFHHQPFAYFARYAPGTPERARHLQDEADVFRDLTTGRLPAVAFVKPIGDDNEHPGYSTVAAGQQPVAKLVKAVQESPMWPHTVLIVTYDEHGGRWDHVPPPIIDRWGPGLRVPTVIISPFAKQGCIDHTPYETASILTFIETRWGLPPLDERDRQAADLTLAFEF